VRTDAFFIQTAASFLGALIDGAFHEFAKSKGAACRRPSEMSGAFSYDTPLSSGWVDYKEGIVIAIRVCT
jgi:hypothetical protein